jgi:Tol biopolymer transport system component
MAQPFDPVHLAFTGDGVPVAEKVSAPGLAVGAAFSVSSTGAPAYRSGTAANGVGVLTMFDRQGKAVKTLGEPGFAYLDPAFSPDGAQVVFSRLEGTGGSVDLWLHEFARGTSTRFTFGPGSQRYPVWSPDSTRVVFSNSSDGVPNLYWKVSSNAGKEEALLKSSNGKETMDWSRDGRYLLYADIDKKTGRDLWYLPMTSERAGGDRKPVLYLKTGFNEDQARFSPDGRFVAYRSNASGVDQIYVQPFPDPSGGKWQVSTTMGREPRWRRDGQELLFTSTAGTVMSVEVSLSPAFKMGTPKELFRLRRITTAWDMTGDGQKFIAFTLPSGAAENRPLEPITVVLNWEAGLRK